MLAAALFDILSMLSLSKADLCTRTFEFNPVFGGQDRGHHLKLGVGVIQPVKAHHMQQLDASCPAHGSSREPHIACFGGGYQCPSLCVGHGKEMLAVPLCKSQWCPRTDEPGQRLSRGMDAP